MNAPIVRLFAVFMLLFALLVAWTSRWTVFQQEELQENANNKRGLLEELRIPRGPIRASTRAVTTSAMSTSAEVGSSRARAAKRFIVRPLPTDASFTTSASTSRL